MWVPVLLAPAFVGLLPLLPLPLVSVVPTLGVGVHRSVTQEKDSKKVNAHIALFNALDPVVSRGASYTGATVVPGVSNTDAGDTIDEHDEPNVPLPSLTSPPHIDANVVIDDGPWKFHDGVVSTVHFSSKVCAVSATNVTGATAMLSNPLVQLSQW